MKKEFVSIIPENEIKKMKENMSLFDKIKNDLDLQIILYGSLSIKNNKDYIILNKNKYKKKDFIKVINKAIYKK